MNAAVQRQASGHLAHVRRRTLVAEPRSPRSARLSSGLAEIDPELPEGALGKLLTIRTFWPNITPSISGPRERGAPGIYASARALIAAPLDRLT